MPADFINRDPIPVIHDAEMPRWVRSEGGGYVPRDFAKEPIGVVEYEKAFDEAMDLMPIPEIVETLIRQEREKSSLWHVWERNGKFQFSQSRLNYCHSFSPRSAFHLLLCRDGGDKPELSASSIAAPITRYTNRGAPIYRALQQAVDVGFAETSFVPSHTTSSRDFKQGWKENAARHKFREWLTMAGSRNLMRGLHQQLTMACRNNPVCNGLNYWGHAVTDLRFVLTKEPTGVRTIDDLYPCLACDFLNTHGRNYGKDGVGRRVGRQMICDQAYAPTLAEMAEMAA
jgi:hypothetical protein